MFWEWICATTEVLFGFAQLGILIGIPFFHIYAFIDIMRGVINKNYKPKFSIVFYDSDTFNSIQQNNKYYGDPTYSYLPGNAFHNIRNRF